MARSGKCSKPTPERRSSFALPSLGGSEASCEAHSRRYARVRVSSCGGDLGARRGTRDLTMPIRRVQIS